ncbi:MAG: hypothetical protein ACRCST_17585 [Turicibacter sp.]
MRKLKNELKQAFEPPTPKQKNEFLKTLDYPKMSEWGFLRTQAGYIRKRVWICFVMLFLFALVGTIFYPHAIFIVTLISSISPFLALITVTELSRSVSFNMAELEMSCKYPLVHVVLARMLILGSLNILFFCVFLFTIIGKTDYGLVQLTIYLLAPYVLTCTGSLLVINQLQTKELSYVCGGIAGLVSMVQIILQNKIIDVYLQQHTVFWSVIFLVVVGMLIREIRIFINRMGDLQWSFRLTD